MGVEGPVFLGVDVGTGSARAGLFDASGHLLSSASYPIKIWQDGHFAEQSTADIWQATCSATRTAMEEAGVTGADIKGVGFDGTCSVVAVGQDDRPVTVSQFGDPQRDIIVWLDHRALGQTERINNQHSPVLQYVGGKLSPEMQPPKLLWLKENLPETWAAVSKWMDLPDWLTYRATGCDTRSLCTTVCKWTYQGHLHQGQDAMTSMLATGWDSGFWQAAGLGDLIENNYHKIGSSVAFPGQALGDGLKSQAAKDLGLLEGTPVAAALIDAHAGGLGCIGGVPEGEGSSELSRRVVLVAGTSNCHMAVSKEKLYVPGVWGPYWSAMVPGLWLTEGGQSATGALLDYTLANHAATPALLQKAKDRGMSIFALLNDLVAELAAKSSLPYPALLTQHLHVLPDHHGNRSPRADPHALGSVVGLSLDQGEADLVRLYLATVQALAYGTRAILQQMRLAGHKIDVIVACGGLAKNRLFLQEHADITGCPVVLPREAEPVLLGSAVLGAVAAGHVASVQEGTSRMTAAGEVIKPSSNEQVKRYHTAKYDVTLDLYSDQQKYREKMERGAC